MTEEHLPLTATNGIPAVQPDLPVPPNGVPALPRPRDDEPKPFSARAGAPEWLVAYA